jgi:predicted transcriptional regulator
MSKWAKLHAKISESYDFADACNEDPKAGLLFVLGIAHADVYGVLVGDPRLLVGRVFGLVKVTEAEAAKAVKTLEKAGLITRYEDDRGRPYLWFPRYSEHQSIEWVRIGPPEHPLPPQWELPRALVEACERKNSKGEFVASDSLRRWVAAYKPDQSPTSRRPVADQSSLDTDTDTEQDTAPDDGAATRNESDEQAAIRQAFEALTGQDLPKSLPGYSAAMKLVTEYGLPTVREWTDFLRGQEAGVPEGANAWAHFKTAFRRAMNRDFEWRGKGGNGQDLPRPGLRGWPDGLTEPDFLRRLSADEVDALARSPDWSRFSSLRTWLSARQVQAVEERHEELARGKA